jgi:8-amino-7-oxononanoate synthase
MMTPMPNNQRARHPESPFGGLLDFPAAEYWLRLFDAAQARREYPYQPAIGRREGNIVEVDGEPYLLVSAYDYLGLLGDPAIEAAAMDAIRRYGTGTSGVRLLTGTLDLHLLLEEALALFTGKEAAMTFSSGYAANLSLLSALITADDHVYADQFIHRSLVEGLRLSGCPVTYFRHNDAGHLERLLARQQGHGRTFIISEGVFSMEGDMGCVRDLIALRNRFGAFLIVDEAHSLGMLGRGICAYSGLDPADVDIITGSLSKAIPAQGGFVAGSRALITFLQHTAPTYIFSSALNPPALAAALKALEIISREPWRGTVALERAMQLRQKLHRAGFNTGMSGSAVIPVMLGDQDLCLAVTAALRRQHIIASPIVYPAVPRNRVRLRVCTSTHFTEDQMDHLVTGLHHGLDEYRNTREAQVANKDVNPQS